MEWASAHRKDKKATLAAAMESAFAGGGNVPVGVTAEGRAAALAWAPPGFHAFDRGRIDDGEDGAAEADPARRTHHQRCAEIAAGEQHHDAAPEAGPPPRTTRPSTPPWSRASTRRPSRSAWPLARARQDEVDALNAVPTADGGPRVIVRTEGLDGDGNGEAPPDADPPMPPVRGNGHDSDGLEIPAFLRRG